MYILRLLNAAILAATIIIAPTLYGVQPNTAAAQTVALSFDIDDVISGKPKVGIADFITLMPRMLYWSPVLITVLFNQRAIKVGLKKEFQYRSITNGGSNYIHAAIEYLKGNGYDDLSCYEQEINERSQKPYPIDAMITYIKDLKAQGYTIVGATNQDYLQHQAYRKHLKVHYDIDLNELFDAVVTTRVHHIAQPAGDELAYRVNADDNIYVTRQPEDVKPNRSYFKAVDQLVKQINPDIETIIHIDDRYENVLGALNGGLKAIHFDLKDKSVNSSTPEEIQNTVRKFQENLECYSIYLTPYLSSETV